jgi:hypothetical protein
LCQRILDGHDIYHFVSIIVAFDGVGVAVVPHTPYLAAPAHILEPDVHTLVPVAEYVDVDADTFVVNVNAFQFDHNMDNNHIDLGTSLAFAYYAYDDTNSQDSKIEASCNEST